MKVSVPINTILEECMRCPYFELEMDNLYAFNRIDTIVYKCAHINICENAIELYKKHIGAENDNEEAQKSL